MFGIMMSSSTRSNGFDLQQLQRLPAVDGGRHVRDSPRRASRRRQRVAIVLDVVDDEQRGVGCRSRVHSRRRQRRILPSSRGSSTGLVSKSSQPAASAFSLIAGHGMRGERDHRNVLGLRRGLDPPRRLPAVEHRAGSGP